MHKIKYRGWHVQQQKMYDTATLAEDQLTVLATGQFINVSSVSPLLSQVVPLDQMIPMLSIGNYDRKGREVYVGDIVKGHDGAGNRLVGAIEYNPVWGRYTVGFGGVTATAQLMKQCEIVGNTYEHPELVNQLSK